MFDRDSAGMEGVRGAKHGARIRETSFQDAGTKDDGGREALALHRGIPCVAASTLSNSRPSAFYPYRNRGSTKARTEPRTFAIAERMLCLSSFSPCLFSLPVCVCARASGAVHSRPVSHL